MEKNEIWKDIPGFEGRYEVSNLGRVKSFQRKRWIKQNNCFVKFKGNTLIGSADKDGYPDVYIDGHNYRVHRLIGMTFLPNPENKPQINHKNGIKNDNRLENLEWVTASENHKHAYSIGLNCKEGELNNAARLKEDEVYQIRFLWHFLKIPQGEIANYYNISRPHVSGIVNNKFWKI